MRCFPISQSDGKIFWFFRTILFDLFQEKLILSDDGSKNWHRSDKSERKFLFGFKTENLHQNVQCIVVGGRGIVFSCYENVNKTVIDDAKVKKLFGYDANSLYLSENGGNMHRGPLTH